MTSVALTSTNDVELDDYGFTTVRVFVERKFTSLIRKGEKRY
jgi:hypothetical protein